jgi:hypothetical protein
MKILDQINERITRYRDKYNGLSRVERNRFLVLFISLLLILDYFMFSYHINKNIFSIFPALPRIDFRSEINIYVPDKDAKNILKETRSVLVPREKEIYAGMLYRMIAKGSRFDNTSSIVPVKTYVRNVWIGEKRCVIDIDFESAKERIEPVENSETAFKKAVEMTIAENITGITQVHVLLNGVPRKLW